MAMNLSLVLFSWITCTKGIIRGCGKAIYSHPVAFWYPIGSHSFILAHVEFLSLNSIFHPRSVLFELLTPGHSYSNFPSQVKPFRTFYPLSFLFQLSIPGQTFSKFLSLAITILTSHPRSFVFQLPIPSHSYSNFPFQVNPFPASYPRSLICYISIAGVTPILISPTLASYHRSSIFEGPIPRPSYSNINH